MSDNVVVLRADSKIKPIDQPWLVDARTKGSIQVISMHSQELIASFEEMDEAMYVVQLHNWNIRHESK